MYATLKDQLADDLATIRAEGLYKAEGVITTPQSARIKVGDQTLINFCSNNYLGLADHPAMVAAAQQANQADKDMNVTGMVTEADQQTREITIEDQTYVMPAQEALFPQVGAEITLFYREEGGQKVITRIGQKQD